MLLATGSAGTPDFSDVERGMQGLGCGQLGGADYCFPRSAVNGETSIAEAVFVRIPVPSTQKEDCFRVTDDGFREIYVREATLDDTMEQRAQRSLGYLKQSLVTPLVPTSWNELDCFKSGYRTGWSCMINEASLSEGMTFIECDGAEDVPVPHCTQTYYTRQLEVRLHYVVQCGVHWREINRQVDTVLSAAAAMAHSRPSG
jgi:hypothetical protein